MTLKNMSSISEEEELERQALIDSIPEFASFENQKENILPLKGGRRAKALAGLFQLSDDEKQLMIQQGQDRYEKELELLDEMDDPLDVFIRRLQWLMETFPQGDNQESKIVDFLQQVSYHFQDDTRYYSDPRYLNFWVQYSKWTVEPKEVFLYLMNKGIGQNLALFYEEYSILYEGREKYKEAADALELGIKRNAQPIGRLKRAREQLEDRIKYKKRSSSSSSSMDSSILSHSLQVKNSPLPRTILGHKPNPKIPYSIPENIYRNSSHSMPSTIPLQQAAGSNHYTTSFSSSNVSSRRPFGNENLSQNQKSNFTVYVDNDTDSIISASTSISTSSTTQIPFESILPSSTSTKSLSHSVFSKNKQENILPAEAYSGVTFPLASKPRIQPTFTVYRDDDESNLNQSGSSEDKSSQQIQSSSNKISKNRLVNECIFGNQHMGLLEERFRRFSKSYIYYKNVSGRGEFIASTRECLGASGRKEPISYEELRLAKQVNRKGESQLIKGIAAHSSKLTDNDAIIPSKIGSYSNITSEYTTETHAAYQMINALFHKRTESKLFDEEEKLNQSNDDSNHTPKKVKRTINENCEN